MKRLKMPRTSAHIRAFLEPAEQALLTSAAEVEINAEIDALVARWRAAVLADIKSHPRPNAKRPKRSKP